MESSEARNRKACEGEEKMPENQSTTESNDRITTPQMPPNDDDIASVAETFAQSFAGEAAHTPTSDTNTASDAMPDDEIEDDDDEPPFVLTKENINAAYFNLWRQLILAMCVFYIRRYPDRIATNIHSQAPISCAQIRRALDDDNILYSAQNFRKEHEWMDRFGIPTLTEATELMKYYSDELGVVRNAADRNHCSLNIEHIRNAFNLDSYELLILMAVALSELDDAILRCLQLAAGDMTRQKFDALFFCELCAFTRDGAMDYLNRLSDRSQLIRMRLIIPERPLAFTGNLPRSFSNLTVAQRVLDALCGADLQANLSPHMRYIDHPPRPIALILPDGFLTEFKMAIKEPRARIIVTGAPHSGRMTTTSAFAKSYAKQSTIAIDLIAELESLPESDIEAHVCDALREALLLDSVVVFQFDALKEGSRSEKLIENHTPPLSRHIANYPGRIVITAQHNTPKIAKLFGNPIECHIPLPTPEQQEKVWREALAGVFDDKELDRITSSFANNYQLTIGQIFTAVTRAIDDHEHRQRADRHAKLESHHILEEIRQCFSHDLASLADVVLSDVPIDRVILPESTQKTVKEILNFARYQRKVLDDWGYRKCSAYGNSLSILFSGPPGTGKTLLATAMANELGKILYRVDLSRIVDKYIGETEKNLAKIFDEASKAQAILLFDEADSLFAKRTDVKSSNDRYANLEVNFLIQKLESYNGISILTTNLQTSIDEAFKRRLRYIVEFKEPNDKERQKLWQTLIAPNPPLDDDIQWRVLADNFELSGGHIRNATLNASIRAAANSRPLGMQYLLEAAIAETQKLGKLVKLSDKILLMLDDYGVEI